MTVFKRICALFLTLVLLMGLGACAPKMPEPPAADPTSPIISYTPHTCPTEDP